MLASRCAGAIVQDLRIPWQLQIIEQRPHLAFEIADAPDVARKLLLEQRLVVNATGPTTIRLLPPLTVTREEIEEALSRLRLVLGS